MSRIIDISGQRFGRWTVGAFTGRRYFSSALWACVCECGTERDVTSNSLVSGKSQSCGCARIEEMIARQSVHGQARKCAETPEYQTWKGLKRRCLDPKHKDFAMYGGRGISVCSRWLNDSPAFYADMGSRPYGTSIDRIDANGNYEPLNCRWASFKAQVENRRPFVQPIRRGADSNLAKLTAAQVSQIRSLAGLKSQRAIGEMFGVTQSCVSQIIRGQTWAENLMPAVRVAA